MESSLWILGGVLAFAALCCLMNWISWIWPLALFAAGVCWGLVKLRKSEDEAPKVGRFLVKWLSRGSLTGAIDDLVWKEVGKRVKKRVKASIALWISDSEITCKLMAESQNLRHAAIRKFRNSLISMILLLPSSVVIVKYLLSVLGM